jgi:hypothetical protein
MPFVEKSVKEYLWNCLNLMVRSPNLKGDSDYGKSMAWLTGVSTVPSVAKVTIRLQTAKLRGRAA